MALLQIETNLRHFSGRAVFCINNQHSSENFCKKPESCQKWRNKGKLKLCSQRYLV